MSPWNNESNFLKKFENWLKGPDGKSKPERQAKQHSRQTEIIIRDASNGSFDVNALFDRQMLRENWLLKLESSRAPGTVKSYLYSLVFFYKYIQCDAPQELVQYLNQCSKMIVIVQNWISVYRKKLRGSHWKKELEQLDQLLTSEEIKKLDDSNTVKFCKKVLKEVRDTSRQNSFKEFTNARDYIIMCLCLDNGSRTGALSNMTINEFQKAKPQGRSFTVRVENHKTLETSGPATLCFSSTLYSEAEKYLVFFRNNLEGVSVQRTDPFFVSWQGKKMSSSMVTAQLNSFWNRAVGKTEQRSRFNATLVRKSCVTKVHSTNPELKNDLANLMCHSIKTASKTYYLQEKSKNASQTSSQLRSLLRQPETVDCAIEEHFKQEIENKKITLTLVKAKKKLSPLFEEYTDVQLRDKIRYFIMKKSAPEGIIIYFHFTL